MITRGHAIEIALSALSAEGTRVKADDAIAIRKDGDMHYGANCKGWVIFVPLDIPPGIEPNEARVEVYDPEGVVYIYSLI